MIGLWRWIRCEHEHVRCIHGDEIIAAMPTRGPFRRARCRDCGRALDRGLPQPCTYTGRNHASTTEEMTS